MTTPDNAVIDVHIERAFYDTALPALAGFSLRVARGEVVALLGKSGCGKSTLLQIIASLHGGYDGQLSVAQGADIGYIPQHRCLLPWKTVYQNVTLLHRRARNAKPDNEKAQALLNRLGIAPLQKKYPSQLSGGEYQRAVLGQVFYYRPQIILMDEPFSALDEATKEEIIQLFIQLQKENAITTIFVTHNTREAEAISSRVIRLGA